jgi:hypothetical protein
MKTGGSKLGQFAERPYFSLVEIENLCASELRAHGLYPSKLAPVRIDRFIEKRFGVTPTYEQLPDGVLGFTEFGPRGVKAVVVSSDLEDAVGTPNERRLRTTLAHEAGHGLMHAHLFIFGEKPTSLFGDAGTEPKILCRDVDGEGKAARGYGGRWWEFQANKAIGGLLMPRDLVRRAIEGFVELVGSLGQGGVPETKKDAAARHLANVFNVNPAVARIRLADVMPTADSRQLPL